MAWMSPVRLGSGSGLFSLAARRLGASVYSFDYDPRSVACARELKSRYFPGDSAWTISEGSALDVPFLSSLGSFDVVYSWGVLHHTGSMWQALENMIPLVCPSGRLFIAIYNDQGTASRRWLAVKKAYNALPGALRFLITWPAFAHFWWGRSSKTRSPAGLAAPCLPTAKDEACRRGATWSTGWVVIPLKSPARSRFLPSTATAASRSPT